MFSSKSVYRTGNTIAWIALPSLLWITIALLLTDDYTWTNLLLANKFLGPHDSMTAGRLWFVEVLFWILVALTAACALPSADRWERRRPFAFAAAFLYAWLNRETPARSALYGTIAGAHACTVPSTEANAIDLKELLRLTATP